jgi:hypothetical protein
MRNDARPIGPDLPDSPTGEEPRDVSEQPDARESFTHDGQSPVRHRQSENEQPEGPDGPVTPSSDGTGRRRL